MQRHGRASPKPGYLYINWFMELPVKKTVTILSLVLMSSTAFAFDGLCIYTDNAKTEEKPNGSIKSVPVTIDDKESVELVSLKESSGLIQAKLEVRGKSKILTVANARKVLFKESSDVNSGANFLDSYRDGVFGSIEVSIVCIPAM